MTTSTPSLKPSMRMLGALLITLSAITPASSVFIIGPGIIQQAGTGSFLALIAAAIVGLLTAFVYGELSSAFPFAGGEYAIVGRIMGPFWGMLVLGTNLIAALLMLAILSVGIGSYLHPFFPSLDPVTAGACAAIVATGAGLFNIRANAVITGLFLGLELLALIVLMIFGLLHPERSLATLAFSPVNLGADGALHPATASAIGLATAIAIFAYNGYGQAVYLAEEMHEAPKRIARTIFAALAITVAAEAMPMTAVLLGAPDLRALFASDNMLGAFIALRGGPVLALLFSASIALAILNANIAFMIMVARLIFSTGRDGIWNKTANQALMRLNHHNTPWAATLACGALSFAACFIDQHFLMVITGTALVFVYGMMCVAAIAGRRNGITAHAAYRMPLFPAAPGLALLMMGYIVYTNLIDPEIGRPSLLATIGLVILSALYYLLVLRRRHDWRLRGPGA